MEGTYARDTWDASLAYTYTDGGEPTPGGNDGKPSPNRFKHAATLRVNGDLLPGLRGFPGCVEYLGELGGTRWTWPTRTLTTVGLGAASLRRRVPSLGVRDLRPVLGPEEPPGLRSPGASLVPGPGADPTP